MYCKYARITGKSCNCANRVPLIHCENPERQAALEERHDAARSNSKIESGALLVRQQYCNADHCCDFSPAPLCKYATVTDRKWVGLREECTVVECRSPEAKGNLRCFKDANGVEYPAVRKPCDENYNLLPNADYLHVRSRFCNELWCPYYTDNNEKDS